MTEKNGIMTFESEEEEAIYILQRLNHVSCNGFENCTVGSAICLAIEALKKQLDDNRKFNDER